MADAHCRWRATNVSARDCLFPVEESAQAGKRCETGKSKCKSAEIRLNVVWAVRTLQHYAKGFSFVQHCKSNS